MMEKSFYILLLAFALGSCESTSDVKSDIDQLRNERALLQNELEQLESEWEQVKDSISIQLSKLNVAEKKAEGREPTYIVRFKLSQFHLTLDIGQHVKDEMNSAQFEMPVDEAFYYAVKEDMRIVDDFRIGSFILNGSFGEWDLRVIDKEIRYSQEP